MSNLIFFGKDPNAFISISMQDYHMNSSTYIQHRTKCHSIHEPVKAKIKVDIRLGLKIDLRQDILNLN